MELGLISIVVTVTVTVVIFFLQRRAAPKREPVWAYKTEQIIGLETNTPPELKLYFGDSLVNEVYRTKFILFNRGRETINQDDVTDNLNLQFIGGKILGNPTIERYSKATIRFHADKSTKEGSDTVRIAFLYLGKDDGAIVDVLHTKVDCIKFSGNIKGVEMVSVGKFEQYRKQFRHSGLMPVFWMGIAILTVIIVDYFVSMPPTEKLVSQLRDSMATRAAFGSFIGVYFVLLGFEIKHFLKYRHFPKWSLITLS